MIKTELVRATGPNTYPYIGQDVGLFVLFSKAKCGTVVHSGTRAVGEYRTDWLEETFSPAAFDVVLRNK